MDTSEVNKLNLLLCQKKWILKLQQIFQQILETNIFK